MTGNMFANGSIKRQGVLRAVAATGVFTGNGIAGTARAAPGDVQWQFDTGKEVRSTDMSLLVTLSYTTTPSNTIAPTTRTQHKRFQRKYSQALSYCLLGLRKKSSAYDY